jgi:hypothetical protein
MYISNDHTLLEFARVGTIEDNIEISVYAKEGKIPHLHFYCIQDGRKGCIRLDVAQYFSHGNKSDRLSKKELKSFIKWLDEDCHLFKVFNVSLKNYDYICQLWNENNPNNTFNFDLIDEPDYSSLNKGGIL